MIVTNQDAPAAGGSSRGGLPMKKTTADREHELLEAIVTGQQANGFAPTRRELAKTIGISTTRVQQLISNCSKKGLLSCPPRAARAYVIHQRLPQASGTCRGQSPQR